MEAALLREIAEVAGVELTEEEAAKVKDNPVIPIVTRDELGTLSIVWKDGDTSLQAMVGDLHLTRGQMNCVFSARQKKDEEWKWLVEPSRLNLLSLSAKKQFLQTLEKRSLRDWSWRISQIVALAQEEISKLSEPVQLHTITPASSMPSWLFKPLLETGQHTVLAAEGGTGKSLIALAACISVGLGKSVIPDMWASPDHSIKSLYLDWETDAQTHARRVREVCNGMGWKHIPNTISHIKMNYPITEQVRELRQVIAKEKYGLVVVDSVGVAVNGDINDAAAALDYMRAIRALGNCAVLSVTHLAKENRGTPIGSVYFREGPRSSWLAVSEQDEGSKESYIGLFHKKVNNWGVMRPIGLRAEFGNGEMRYYPQGLGVFSKASSHLSVAERVFSLLTNGPLKLTEIEAALDDVRTAELKRTLNRLHNAGKIVRNGDEIGLRSESDE